MRSVMMFLVTVLDAITSVNIVLRKLIRYAEKINDTQQRLSDVRKLPFCILLCAK